MKKTPERKTLYSLIFFLSLSVLTVVLLASCEPTSLSGGWQDAGLIKPEDSVTTAPPSSTGESPLATLPTTTSAQVTTAPPVTTASPALYYSPLSGLPCGGKEALARPLSFCVTKAGAGAISMSDIVIEAATEGSATRLSLIGTAHTESFNALEISSTRPYLATLTNDFFAISIFRGTTDNPFSATDFLFDTVDLSEEVCSTSEALLQRIEKAGYQTAIADSIALPYRLSPLLEEVKPSSMRSSYISVPFGGDAATTFTYDAIRGAYTMRTGSALADDGGNLPIFTNLIILFHDATKRVTKDGIELSLDTSLGGSGYYLTAGGAVPIFWRRDPVTSSLRLTDEDGTLLSVNRGKTYLAMTTYEHRDALIMN